MLINVDILEILAGSIVKAMLAKASKDAEQQDERKINNVKGEKDRIRASGLT